METPQKKRYKKSTILHGNVEKVADKKSHYVDRQKFYEAIVERKEILKTNPDHPVSPYIGECIVKICKGLASKWNFAQYTWKDELVSDAILHVLKYIDSFNPEISTNPFSYFTQTAYNSFMGRFEIEREEQYAKYASILKSASTNEFFQQPDSYSDYEIDLSELNMEDIGRFVVDFEKKQAEAKDRQKNRIKKPSKKSNRMSLENV
jgi:hypothetical protein